MKRLEPESFGVRVEVEGKDGVANLARSINETTERIEKLVTAQRTLFGEPSHELRSPLARMRRAAELLPGDEHSELRERLRQDVTELDDLIAEILLASRLHATGRLDHLERTEVQGFYKNNTSEFLSRFIAVSTCVNTAILA